MELIVVIHTKFIKSLSLFLLLHAASLSATTIIQNDDNLEELQTRARTYYDHLGKADKAFFAHYFNVDDLYGEQNDEAFQKLCALVPQEAGQKQASQNWDSFRESQISPEDTIGVLSHHLKSLLLDQNAVPNTWFSSSLDIVRKARHSYRLNDDDYQVSECSKALLPLTTWSPEKNLPFNVFSAMPYGVRRYLDITTNLDLLKAKSFGKPVAWYLKAYQNFVDRIGEVVAFYRVPHSAKTPRTLVTNSNHYSMREYFFFYADVGEIFVSIFKARLEFLKTHADAIDDLLSQGFVFSEEVLSLPAPKLDENWHDIRPIRYYFKDEISDERVRSPLFAAMPHIVEAKEMQVKRQLPLTSGVVQLRHQIEAYHAFNKKDDALVDERISALLKISHMAALLSKEGDDADTVTPLQRDLLHELEVNAKNKSEYLNRLKAALKTEKRRRNRIPFDMKTTTPSKIRPSQKVSEIYADLDPENRFLPLEHAYSKLHEEPFLQSDIKLQKVAHLLEVDMEEFERAEQQDGWHKALEEQVNLRYSALFPKTQHTKKIPPYFLWLENKDMSEVTRDLRRSVPESDMLVEVREGKAFNTVFAKEDRPVIEDGVYLYVIPEDGKLYVFPGERSELVMIDDNSKLHEIAKNKYGVDFKEFGTRTIHPMLCKGKNVFSAGEVQFKDGEIVHINNHSGHYVPGEYHLLNGLKRLMLSYHALFSTEATVGLVNVQHSIAYGQFMTSDFEKLRQGFLLENPNQ